MLPLWQLIGKRILYNIPTGAKYFHSNMIMLTEIFYYSLSPTIVNTYYELVTTSYLTSSLMKKKTVYIGKYKIQTQYPLKFMLQ